MEYTSITVTPDAQKAYLAKNPNAARANKENSAAFTSSATSTSKAIAATNGAKPPLHDAFSKKRNLEEVGFASGGSFNASAIKRQKVA